MVGGGVAGMRTQAARMRVRVKVMREIGCGPLGFSWWFLVSGERYCRRRTAADLADDGDMYLFVRPHMERWLKSNSCSDGGKTARCRSEPAASVWIHLIFPVSWSKDWGSP